MENLNKRSIIDMARGAIKERADYEMTRVSSVGWKGSAILTLRLSIARPPRTVPVSPRISSA